MLIKAFVCIVGLACIAAASYWAGINQTVRVSGVLFITFLPLLLGLPCLCCVPQSRKTVATIGCGWALLYGAGMTLGPRSMATWTAWIFTELWLGYVLRGFGWLVYYGVKGVGIVLSSATNLVVLSFIVWIGWNLYVWLERRQQRYNLLSTDKGGGVGNDDKVD